MITLAALISSLDEPLNLVTDDLKLVNGMIRAELLWPEDTKLLLGIAMKAYPGQLV
jgi:hypothetical protein